jgi:large subunit ribosomal protein L10
LEGGESTLAISKERKHELVTQYVDWLDRSQALIVTQYSGLTMKDIDNLRARIRESGGEFHIVKNTLGSVAFSSAGLELPEGLLDGSTAIIFAFRDAPDMAKVVTDFARTSEFVKIKGGYLDRRVINADEVKSLAELPPLPVMRAQLLGVLAAPASKLVRTLAEPGRSLAAVLQAYVDTSAGPAPEAAEAA